MRYSKEHKSLTRARIVRAAARRFRERGVEGAAIGGVMRELHLTHGGFYRHFPSKRALFDEALDAAFAEVGDRIAQAAEQAPPGGALEAIVATYLSTQHCERPETGCPVAALGPDLARLPRSARASVQRALERYAARMAVYLPGRTSRERARRALALFAAMAGTMAVARAMTEPAAREQVLADGRRMLSHGWDE